MGKIKLLLFIISITLYLVIYVFRIDVTADTTTDTKMITERDVKAWIARIENSTTAKQKICTLGTTFIFSNATILDGKLVLFYNFDENDTYCYEVLHGNKSERSQGNDVLQHKK